VKQRNLAVPEQEHGRHHGRHALQLFFFAAKYHTKNSPDNSFVQNGGCANNTHLSRMGSKLKGRHGGDEQSKVD
jgi:hypothetical protein